VPPGGGVVESLQPDTPIIRRARTATPVITARILRVDI